MEMVDIQNNRIHQHLMIVLVIHPNIAEEVIQIEEVRQAIALRGLDDATLFRQFNTTGDADLNDLSRGIRLGNKVNRSDFETVNLCRLVCRHHDDRNAPELLLFLHHLQYFHAVHLRHLKIQHD